jgi:hypothetical protein
MLTPAEARSGSVLSLADRLVRSSLEERTDGSAAFGVTEATRFHARRN